MKVKMFLAAGILFGALFCGCSLNGKQILAKRIQNMQKSSGNPVTIEEIKDAIRKYDAEAQELQQKNAKIGLWYKILGTRYIDRKMYGEALECFQRALEFYPENPNLYYYVGICAGYMSKASLDFNATGSFEKKKNYLKLAESAYLRAVDIDARFANALYGLGILYMYELDDAEKAVTYLERYLDIETRSIDGMFALAGAYYVNDEFDKSVALYDKIISISKSEKNKADAQANKKAVLDASYGL